MGGATAYYGIRPDIITYVKIIGGGMPVGAFGGRSEVMDMLSPDGPVYQAGTLSGNPVAMTAGLTALRKLADGKIHSELEQKNRRFVSVLSEQLRGNTVNVVGVSSIFWIVFQKDIPRTSRGIDSDGIAHYNRFHGKALDAGLYLPPSGYEVCFISAAHTDDMLESAAQTLVTTIKEEAHKWA
jgi:glutamate-1-semialdehyde 2,1-aminomutase